MAFGETLAGSHMYRNREWLQGVARPVLTDSTAVTSSPRLPRNGLCPGPRRAAQRSNQGGTRHDVGGDGCAVTDLHGHRTPVLITPQPKTLRANRVTGPSSPGTEPESERKGLTAKPRFFPFHGPPGSRLALPPASPVALGNSARFSEPPWNTPSEAWREAKIQCGVLWHTWLGTVGSP